jgi:hypothetical protein
MPKAIVCQRIERIDGVTRTWFEWAWDGSAWVKTLVVEVEFNTDPNEYEFRRAVLDEIQKTARNVLTEEATMIVSRLKVVPRITGEAVASD